MFNVAANKPEYEGISGVSCCFATFVSSIDCQHKSFLLRSNTVEWRASEGRGGERVKKRVRIKPIRIRGLCATGAEQRNKQEEKGLMRGKHRRMGGKLTYHLNSKEHRYISERIADMMENLAPLYRRHYGSNLLTHMRNKHMEPTEPRPLIQHPDVVAHTGIVLEGTVPQYLDWIWTHRHLEVTSSFTVESRDAKQVFEGGWGCKTELVLSGCQICTSIQDHRELVDDMCRHITGNSGGKLACWDCPTAFPVFIQHPYNAPVCLATASHQEQTRWTNILRAATQHQSSGIVL
ncbi:protein Niban 2-like [Seriola aureovittata]|uniref:protein Niban 2-like n=1 Tax=Seriola aureovittata TaxID=2871759 RepID=UPI0024BD83FE|nr:protein Niban 2-like [Seriola aureovittata]